jgi:hypothetical protein
MSVERRERERTTLLLTVRQILTNPLYLFFTIFFGVTAFVVYSLGLARPLLTVVRTVGEPAVAAGKARIRSSN